MSGKNLPVSRESNSLIRAIDSQSRITKKVLSDLLSLVNVFHVPADGTIEEALKRIRPGGRVVVAPGEYRLSETLIIRKSVSLEGAGMEQSVIWADFAADECMIDVAVDSFFVSGISFLREGVLSGDIMSISSKDFRIEQCLLAGSAQAAYEYPSDAFLTCLRIHGSSVGVVTGCVFRFSTVGIWVCDDSRPMLTSNLCESPRIAGVCFLDDSAGICHNNRCQSSSNGYGIFLRNNASPELNSNICVANMTGIRYSQSASGTAQKNICRENSNCGIAIADNASPKLIGNLCEANEWGIAYDGHSAGAARKNICRNNVCAGLNISQTSHPELADNMVEDL